ncbi:hypothetical protein ACIBK9_19930 [Nonomuraea sp. NPDC050227]|uniref:hypothetical protein n=1 Tax=Nonomuraea sp. NPDC050227 TaxID=3364360 RepID=UPI00378831F8
MLSDTAPGPAGALTLPGGPTLRVAPMVGGTSVSEEWCPKNTLLQDYWVTQGPQEG